MIRRLLLYGLFGLLFRPPANAQTPSTPKCIIVMVVPGLTADDLQEPSLLPLRRIASNAAVGWMNTRTARIPGQTEDYEAAAYLSLGSGSRAAGITDNIDELRAVNSRLDHEVRIGALGDMLRGAGLRASIEGAEDDVIPRRSSRLLVAQSNGVVDTDRTSPEWWIATPADLSAVSPVLGHLMLSQMPYGLAARPVIHRPAPGFADLQVYVLADIARADRYARLCLPSIGPLHGYRARMLVSQQLSSFPAILAHHENPLQTRNTLYILLAPRPADSCPDGDRLAPIVMWGTGVEPGLLTSGSTHTPGLVTNTDFLPTVAKFLGTTPPKGLVGRPMSVVPLALKRTFVQDWIARLIGQTFATEDLRPSAKMWVEMHDRWYRRSRKQAAFGGLPTVQFLLVVGSLLSFVASPVRRLSAPALLCALPLALLALPPLSPETVVGSGVLLGAALGAVILAAWIRPAKVKTVAVACLAGLVALTALDLISGGSLLRQAWMSYSVMEGARYYGIGNEYAGAVFGSMMALSVPLLVGRREWWPGVAALWLAMSILIGLPQLGANAGGFLGAALGCATAAITWGRGRIRGRDLLLATGGVVAAMVGLLAVDMARGAGDQSHIARAIGSGSALDVVMRKAALNGWLLFHSPWTLGLVAASYGLWKLWKERRGTDVAVTGAFAGLAAGGAALFALNDSGVLAAATCVLVAYGGFSLFLPIMDRRPRGEGESKA